MDVLTKATRRMQGVISAAYDRALAVKAAGGMVDFSSGQIGGGLLGNNREQQANKARYSQFRGWLYSAINALASEAAAQPVKMGRITGQAQAGAKPKQPGKKKGGQHWAAKAPARLREKAAQQQMEMVLDDPILKALESPNPIQQRWQFVYSFVANLALTGFSYIVGDVNKDGKLELYSLPTTWVTPVHDKGPFAQFRVANPNNPTAQDADKLLDRSQVGFAYLPNPSNPLAAMPPAAAQIAAIQIDDNIQTCQVQFFENGIFPSVIVTMGKDPHPDVPGGIRPRLNGVQRRQVYAAIKSTMGSIANYGNPAIVDGLIESIEKLSMTQNELGWEKSETTVRTRILSAFGVHPFILGEPVAVGGYAQAAIIQERFYKRVNTYLDLLSGVITNFLRVSKNPIGDDVHLWWEECKPHDPSMYWANMRDARGRNDITQDEYRAALGLPPDEDTNQSVISAQQLAPITTVLQALSQGGISPAQAEALFRGMGLPDDLAKELATPPEPPEESAAPAPGLEPGLGYDPNDPLAALNNAAAGLKSLEPPAKLVEAASRLLGV